MAWCLQWCLWADCYQQIAEDAQPLRMAGVTNNGAITTPPCFNAPQSTDNLVNCKTAVMWPDGGGFAAISFTTGEQMDTIIILLFKKSLAVFFTILDSFKCYLFICVSSLQLKLIGLLTRACNYKHSIYWWKYMAIKTIFKHITDKPKEAKWH